MPQGLVANELESMFRQKHCYRNKKNCFKKQNKADSASFMKELFNPIFQPLKKTL